VSLIPEPDAWPLRESSLAVPGAQLYLRDVGSGTILIVLHGGPDFNHNYLLPEMTRWRATSA